MVVSSQKCFAPFGHLSRSFETACSTKEIFLKIKRGERGNILTMQMKSVVKASTNNMRAVNRSMQVVTVECYCNSAPLYTIYSDML